jgi:L-asparaginase
MTVEATIGVVATGGTIASVYEPVRAATAPVLTGDQLVRQLRDLPGHITLECQQFAQRPSWELGPEEMQRIALHVRDLARSGSYSGLVVTHGTATLEYTAYLTDLFLESERSVVFTGAMYRADHPWADGLRNLHDAILTASAIDARGRGVLVCFDGELIRARDAWKRARQGTGAFKSLTEPLGKVSDGVVQLDKPRSARRTYSGRLDASVAMVKAYPGADGTWMSAALARGARGIVVEGLPGVGGIPPTMLPSIRAAVGSGVAVVISSRAPAGTIPVPPTGGTGEPLLGLNLISAGSLTTEKAWILLMVALGERYNVEEIRGVFAREAADTFLGEAG